MSGRIRSIKPEILEDAKAAELSDAAWRLWVSMWLLADDYGNLRGDSRRLAAGIFWAMKRPPPIADLLSELENGGFVQQYTVRGQFYVHLHNWEKHQRIDNAGKARVPKPCEAEQESAETRGEIPRASEKFGSDLDHDHDHDHEEEKEHDTASPKFDFESLYKRYPRKEAKQPGMKALKGTEHGIKTEADFDRFAQAVDNYAAKVKAEGTEQRYMLHWATFCRGRWLDYAEGPQLALDVRMPIPVRGKGGV